jgi:hypothetical protein
MTQHLYQRAQNAGWFKSKKINGMGIVSIRMKRRQYKSVRASFFLALPSPSLPSSSFVFLSHPADLSCSSTIHRLQNFPSCQPQASGCRGNDRSPAHLGSRRLDAQSRNRDQDLVKSRWNHHGSTVRQAVAQSPSKCMVDG